MAHLVVVVLDVVEEAARLKIFHNDLAALETVHAIVLGAGKLVHRAVAVHDVDLLKSVTLADEEVVGVVRRGDLDDACAELLFNVVVCQDRYLASGERQDDRLADNSGEAFVLRVDRNGRIARERLRTRRRHHDVVLVQLALHSGVAADNRIAHIPQMPMVGLMLDLVVG